MEVVICALAIFVVDRFCPFLEKHRRLCLAALVSVVSAVLVYHLALRLSELESTRAQLQAVGAELAAERLKTCDRGGMSWVRGLVSK